MYSPKVILSNETFATDLKPHSRYGSLKPSQAFKFPAEYLLSLSGEKHDVETTCLSFAINARVRGDLRIPEFLQPVPCPHPSSLPVTHASPPQQAPAIHDSRLLPACLPAFATAVPCALNTVPSPAITLTSTPALPRSLRSLT